MSSYDPQDPDYDARVRASFARQPVMQTIGATLTKVSPGEIHITMPSQSSLTQQHGFLHAGIIATALDSACGYAAFSLMPVEAAVLTIEFKINLLAPAQGKEFLFCGRVVRAGRTVTVCNGEAFAGNGDERKLIATMTGTIMAVFNRQGISQ